jgi:hypothetical protein
VILGSEIPYKKQNETQKLFLEDLLLFIAKEFFSLSNYQNVWMHRLALKFNPKWVKWHCLKGSFQPRFLNV